MAGGVRGAGLGLVADIDDDEAGLAELAVQPGGIDQRLVGEPLGMRTADSRKTKHQRRGENVETHRRVLCVG